MCEVRGDLDFLALWDDDWERGGIEVLGYEDMRLNYVTDAIKESHLGVNILTDQFYLIQRKNNRTEATLHMTLALRKVKPLSQYIYPVWGYIKEMIIDGGLRTSDSL